MLDKDDPVNGRRNTRERRLGQSEEVRRIVSERFGETAGDHPFIVLGDLNDYMETDAHGQPGIAPLVEWEDVVNVVERLPEDERWTHFFKGRGGRNPLAAGYHQLDYLLLSRSRADGTEAKRTIVRNGLPKRAERYPGPHFDNVGRDKPKASGPRSCHHRHCLVIVADEFDGEKIASDGSRRRVRYAKLSEKIVYGRDLRHVLGANELSVHEPAHAPHLGGRSQRPARETPCRRPARSL